MGTAVLRSQDCLKGRFSPETLISPSSKHGRNPNRIRSGRRKRSPSDNEADRSKTMVLKFPGKDLVMGQVTILKRGEEIKTQIMKDQKPKEKKIAVEERRSEDLFSVETRSKVESEESLLFSSDRFGPDPEMVQKQIRLTDLKSSNGEIFAGSPFVTSPSPSSLPFPIFFTKNSVSKPNNVTATKDLRRLLRLDLP